MALASMFRNSFFPTVRGIDASDALGVLRQLYDDEKAALLLVVAENESRLDTHARVVNESEDSRGAWQVNVKAWDVSLAPAWNDDATPALERLRLQAVAVKPVLDELLPVARELEATFGAPLANALDLVWQGPERAKRLARRAGRWSREAIAQAITELEDSAKAELFRARDAAAEAAWLAIRKALANLATGPGAAALTGGLALGVGGAVGTLLFLWLLYQLLKRMR